MTAAEAMQSVALAGFESISRTWDPARGCWMARILPGEFYITASGEGITTVLGSCISACVRDAGLGVGGMNHFMLPEDTTQGRSSWLDGPAGLATRYGSFAMESLINGLLRMGARRERLEVKVFGGGHVLRAAIEVGDHNITFARQWLRMEGFRVIAEDVGGDTPRRVIYMPSTGKAQVRRLRATAGGEIEVREQRHLHALRTSALTNDAELF